MRCSRRDAVRTSCAPPETIRRKGIRRAIFRSSRWNSWHLSSRKKTPLVRVPAFYPFFTLSSPRQPALEYFQPGPSDSKKYYPPGSHDQGDIDGLLLPRTFTAPRPRVFAPQGLSVRLCKSGLFPLL